MFQDAPKTCVRRIRPLKPVVRVALTPNSARVSSMDRTKFVSGQIKATKSDGEQGAQILQIQRLM